MPSVEATGPAPRRSSLDGSLNVGGRHDGSICGGARQKHQQQPALPLPATRECPPQQQATPTWLTQSVPAVYGRKVALAAQMAIPVAVLQGAARAYQFSYGAALANLAKMNGSRCRPREQCPHPPPFAAPASLLPEQSQAAAGWRQPRTAASHAPPPPVVAERQA